MKAGWSVHARRNGRVSDYDGHETLGSAMRDWIVLTGEMEGNSLWDLRPRRGFDAVWVCNPQGETVLSRGLTAKELGVRV